MHFRIRHGVIADREWLYNLYCSTMRTYVEQTWGWDEEFQRNGFQSNLHPARFRMVIVEDSDAGAYLVNEEDDHYWLAMLLVGRGMQGKGLGTAIIKSLQAKAEKGGKPLKLSVLKVNPAKELYSRLGFCVYDQDNSVFKMEWVYNKSIQPT